MPGRLTWCDAFSVQHHRMPSFPRFAQESVRGHYDGSFRREWIEIRTDGEVVDVFRFRSRVEFKARAGYSTDEPECIFTASPGMVLRMTRYVRIQFSSNYLRWQRERNLPGFLTGNKRPTESSTTRWVARVLSETREVNRLRGWLSRAASSTAIFIQGIDEYSGERRGLFLDVKKNRERIFAFGTVKGRRFWSRLGISLPVFRRAFGDRSRGSVRCRTDRTSRKSALSPDRSAPGKGMQF